MANNKNITFDQLQASMTKVKEALDGKANTSHGTHVPTPQTANNAKFLRNDNSWQTVTPANIGAAASSHTHSAYVNQNAFSNVVVGSSTIAADSATDTLTILAGTNITLSADTSNDAISITAKDTTYGVATTSANGLMSSTDKSKLDGIASNANNYVHPTTSGNKHIPSGGSSGQILRWSADGTAVWGSDNNTDVNVTNTLNTTTKAYITGTTSSSTNTGTQIFDTGVYLSATAGELVATTFTGALNGNANTASSAAKLTNGRTLTIGNTGKSFDGSGNVSWTLSEIGAAASSHGTHVTYATATPLVAGTAAVGTSSKVAREDHVHPLQTSVSGSSGSCTGNAATATKLQTARTISLTGAVSGSATFDGSGNSSISTALKVPTSGSYWNGGALAVTNDGVTEAGKYIDFHNTSASTNDYDLRLQINNANKNVVTLPGASGTLALTTDNVASATKLQTARKIGNASFNGTADISLNAIMGRAVTSTSSSDKAGQYTKFATINVSGGAYTGCSGKFAIMSTESNKVQGILDYYFRSNSDITSVTIGLYWSSLTAEGYPNTISAVKTSDGVFDLYYRPLGTWETTYITNIDCSAPNLITLYSNQGYVTSITAAATSSLNNYAMSANKVANAITFTGGSSEVYNGSDTATVNIPTNLPTPYDFVIKLNGGTTENTNQFSFDGSATKTVNITASGIGAAPTSHATSATTYGISTDSVYGHAMASSTTPKVAGTAAVGSETAKFARGDHVHPAQTSVTGSSGSCTGNAATATKLQTARTIALSGDVTGSTSFDGSANKTITCTVNTLTSSDLSTIVSNALGVTI